MQEMNPRLATRDVVGYLLAYTCWILVALLSVLAILRVRSSFNIIWVMMSGNLLVLSAIDRLGMVFLCLVCLAYVVFAEDLFRSSISITRREGAKAEVHSSDQAEAGQENKILVTLKRWGLGILARRFAAIVSAPLVVLMLTCLSEWLCYLWLASPR